MYRTSKALALAATTLTLAAAPAIAATPLNDVRLDWTGNGEVQTRPPFGDSNYLSASVSDGTQSTYRAIDGPVQIVQRLADGASEYAASWEDRAFHVAGAPNNAGRQIARLSGGAGEIRDDGSATISWTGSFSVNFYGGLVPFTIKNPVLEIASDKTGTLKADLSGYSSDQGNPFVKTPVPEVTSVTVARLDNVTLSPASTTSITPLFSGVAVSTGSGDPQLQGPPGWGAWPQPFVDFQLQTGLASHWYTSGGSFDANKPPYAFTISPNTPQVILPPLPKPPPTTTTTSTTPTVLPKPASVTAAKKAVKLSKLRRASVATIRCPAVSCTIRVPKSVKVRIRGKRYALSVSAPRSLAAGRSGTVRVTVPKAAAKRLGKRTLKFFLVLEVASTGATTTTTTVAARIKR